MRANNKLTAKEPGKILPLLIDSLIHSPQIQHEIKHIITGYDPAAPGNRLFGLKAAQARILFKKVTYMRLQHHNQSPNRY